MPARIAVLALRRYEVSPQNKLASDIPVVVLSFERSGGLESQRSKWEGMVLCGAAGGA